MPKLVRAVYINKCDRRIRTKANLSHLDNGLGRPTCTDGFRQMPSYYLQEIGQPTCLKCLCRLARLSREVAA